MADEAGDVELLLRIFGDSTSAQASVKDYADATRKYTQDAVKQYHVQSQAATVSARQIKEQMSEALGHVGFLSQRLAGGAASEWAKQAIPEVERYKATIQSLGGQLEQLQGQQSQTAQGFRGITDSLYQSTTQMRHFRAAFGATIGLASFGFWFLEWGRIVDSIKGGIQWMEGFGASAQKAMAELGKYNAQALVQFQGLTTAIKIATGQMLIAQTEQRINADIAERQAIAARSYWYNLLTEIRAVTDAASGNQAALATYFGQFGEKAADAADEAQQSVILQKQLKEEASLEKQLATEKQKGAKASDHVAAAAHREAQAWAAFQLKMSGVYGQLEEMNRKWEARTARSTESVVKSLARAQAEFQKQGSGFTKQHLTESLKMPEGMQQGMNENLRQQLGLLQAEPAAIAAVVRAYPGLTNAQLASLPAMKAVAAAWKDQDTAMSAALSNSLANLTRFENMLPGLGEKYDVMFAQMNSTQQQFTLATVRGSGLVMTALNKELEAHKSLAAGLKAGFNQSLKALASYLTKEAEMKALEQVAMALADLATPIPDVVGAELHFAAAAAWGALGAGVSAAVGAMGGGGRAAGKGSSSSSRSSSRSGASGGSGGGSGGGGAARARASSLRQAATCRNRQATAISRLR